jgi:hypothetical protein
MGEILQVDDFFVFNQSLVGVLVVPFLDEMKSPVFFQISLGLHTFCVMVKFLFNLEL